MANGKKGIKLDKAEVYKKKHDVSTLVKAIQSFENGHFNIQGEMTKETKLWFSSGNGQYAVTFPNASDNGGDLQTLIDTCTQASFGLGGKDVLDPSYRSALKLDTTQFASTFCPYQSGIISTIEREFVNFGENRGTDYKKIRAELYKLNVYREGDFFKSHVDTPRGKSMFGTIVVCLPTVHEGGQLVLRHKGIETVFSGKPDAVTWISFYSNVEHEVLPVVSGCRVTLTYCLYFDDAVSCDVEVSHPWVDKITRVIEDRSFMPQGGLIAYGLEHEYPVEAGMRGNDLLTMLRGKDKLFATAIKKLGYDMHVACAYEGWGGNDRSYAHRVPTCDWDEFKNALIFDEEPRNRLYYGKGRYLSVNEENLKKALQDLKRNPHFGSTVFTTKFIKYSSGYSEDPISYQLTEHFGARRLLGVHWVNKPSINMIELPYTAYGNEPTLSEFYAQAVLLVEVEYRDFLGWSDDEEDTDGYVAKLKRSLKQEIAYAYPKDKSNDDGNGMDVDEDSEDSEDEIDDDPRAM